MIYFLILVEYAVLQESNKHVNEFWNNTEKGMLGAFTFLILLFSFNLGEFQITTDPNDQRYPAHQPERKMQQHNDLLSACFINDFQWRQKQNKGKQSKDRALVV
jgi:hypothetical protein